MGVLQSSIHFYGYGEGVSHSSHTYSTLTRPSSEPQQAIPNAKGHYGHTERPDSIASSCHLTDQERVDRHLSKSTREPGYVATN